MNINRSLNRPVVNVNQNITSLNANQDRMQSILCLGDHDIYSVRSHCKGVMSFARRGGSGGGEGRKKEGRKAAAAVAAGPDSQSSSLA